MIIKGRFGMQDAEERYEFDPENGDYSERDTRPYAWRSARREKALIECRDNRLFINDRRVRIFEPEQDALSHMKFRDMRMLLAGRETPTETICWILQLHRELFARELWNRTLVFFGSGRQVTGDNSVRCLRSNGEITSTFESFLLDEWTADCAALYIEGDRQSAAAA